MSAVRSTTVAVQDTPTTPATMAIGEVIECLASEFPELSPSKVRFLEDRGLVSPNRTASGYRKFTAAHVDRLRLILVLQRDHYMPLREIQSHLDALDRGEAHGAGAVKLKSIGDAMTPPSTEKLRRPEVIGVTGIADELLAELETYGLVKPTQTGFFGATDVQVARMCTRLADFGLEARHLRAFLAAAERERALAEQIVSPLRHQRDGEQSPEAVSAELCRLFAALHAALLGVELVDDTLD